MTKCWLEFETKLPVSLENGAGLRNRRIIFSSLAFFLPPQGDSSLLP